MSMEKVFGLQRHTESWQLFTVGYLPATQDPEMSMKFILLCANPLHRISRGLSNILAQEAGLLIPLDYREICGFLTIRKPCFLISTRPDPFPNEISHD